MDATTSSCQDCGTPAANRCLTFTTRPYPQPAETTEQLLCPRCARRLRHRMTATDSEACTSGDSPVEWIGRRELIARLDQFFAASGILEICSRCHNQGTGCCPPTCRVMGSRGCDPQNRHGKTVFCAAFLCSAILNAIREIDPECARILRWVRDQLGPTEFHLYEMIARVPAAHREPERPLRLPAAYPAPPLAHFAARIRAGLAPLADEILEVQRS